MIRWNQFPEFTAYVSILNFSWPLQFTSMPRCAKEGPRNTEKICWRVCWRQSELLKISSVAFQTNIPLSECLRRNERKIRLLITFSAKLCVRMLTISVTQLWYNQISEATWVILNQMWVMSKTRSRDFYSLSELHQISLTIHHGQRRSMQLKKHLAAW